MSKDRDVSLDIHCTDDIPCELSMRVKITGIVIFLLVMFFII
jgi:hypothetical protein